MVVGMNQHGTEVMYGTCRYCQQIINVTFACNEGASEEEMNRQATLHCTCSGATEYKEMEAAKVRAVDTIEKMIPNEEIKMAMQTLASPICDGEVKTVSIDNGRGTKYSMKLTKKLVEVKVTKTNTETQA